jgi:hypothetical protein
MQKRSAIIGVCLVGLGCLALPVAVQAQTCRCWTAEELTAIIVDTCGCQNNLDLTTQSNTCTGINVALGFDCEYLSTLGQGDAMVIRDGEFGTFECEWAYPPRPNPHDGYLVLNEVEALACAELIAEYGEIAQPQNFECSIDSAPCVTDTDCTSPLGFCSHDGQSCTSGADCPPAGNCSADGAACRSDDDCPGFINFCQNFQPQSCDFQTNFCDMRPECLDECFPPGCNILPTEGPSDIVEIVFTNQTFDAVSGDLSELRADGDFSQANCVAAVNDSYVNSFPLSPGDGVYFLVRAVEGVSCTDHGDSTVVPDPRDGLDANCP